MEARYLGSAYSLIFWVQNIGLALFPILIGKVIMWANPGIDDPMEYNYTVPMLLFASLGVLALFFSIWLKLLDGRKHYGLESPQYCEEKTLKLSKPKTNRPTPDRILPLKQTSALHKYGGRLVFYRKEKWNRVIDSGHFDSLPRFWGIDDE